MTGKTKANFFFFVDDCSKLEINPTSVEHAYLAILNDDLKTAKSVFDKIDSPRAKWGSILVSILTGFLDKYPTFFQIRNFLEIDLDYLLKNEKIRYVEQLLGALDILCNINQETYKFTARVLYENKLKTAALKYMERSKEIYYNDPELHFMFAKYYMEMNCFSQAADAIEICLKLLPDYYPAKLIKQKIAEYRN